MKRTQRTGLFAVLVALALFGAACSSDDSDDSSSTTAAPPSSDATDDTTGGDDTTDDTADASGGFELEDTTVTAFLNQGTGTLVPANSVSVNWYATDGNYAFVFAGADFTSIDLLCPGSSLEGATGFSDVSNGPAVDGACEGYPTALPPINPKVCGDILVAFSAIPLDADGLLRGSLEAGPIATIQSQSSAAQTNGGDVPELDPDADAYVFGGIEYACV